MRRVAALVIIGTAVWAGCSRSDPAAAAEHRRSVRACLAERATVETAVEAFRADHGDLHARPNLTDVVPDFIRRAPSYWGLDGGRVVRVNSSRLSTRYCNPRTQPQ